MLTAKTASLVVLVFLFATLRPGPVRADGGFQMGGRGGVEAVDHDAPFVGADLRLKFRLSPLTVNPTFDYYFVGSETLFQISANTLYDLPISPPLFRPYVGIGGGLVRFAVEERPGVVDSNGVRFGLNLIGGVRFDLPVAAPVIQAMVSIGAIDLVTIGGGVLFDVGGG